MVTPKKMKRTIFFCLVFFAVSAMFTGYARWGPPIRPGDHVYDAQRHNEQKLALAQLLEQAANSLQKINLQLVNLKNMDGEKSTVYASKVQTELNGSKQVSDEFSGMMNKNISSDTVFNHIFKNPTDIELKSREYQAANQSAVLTFLEDTCKDLLKLAHASQKTSQDAEILREMMSLNEDIPGNLVGKQLKNMSLALEISQQIQSGQLDNAIAAVKIAKIKSDMLTENIAARKNRSMIAISYDPFNPTSEDKLNYQHKPSPGFMKFK